VRACACAFVPVIHSHSHSSRFISQCIFIIIICTNHNPYRYGELLARRDAAPEAWLAMQVARVSADQLRLHSTSEALARALQSNSNSGNGSGGGANCSHLALPRAASGAAAAAAAAQAEPLEARLAREHQEFRSQLFARTSEDGNKRAAAEEAQGRETGSVEWRSSRGELGQQAVESSSSTQGSARSGSGGNTLKNLLSKGGWDSSDFIGAMSSQVLGFNTTELRNPVAATAERDSSESMGSASHVPRSTMLVPLVPWMGISSPMSSSSSLIQSGSMGLLRPPLLRIHVTSIGHDDTIPDIYRNDPRSSSKGDLRIICEECVQVYPHILPWWS